MSDGMTMYSQQLRRLVDEYYHQQISVEDYRTQRQMIFDQIEMEQAGGGNSEVQKTDILKEPTSQA